MWIVDMIVFGMLYTTLTVLILAPIMYLSITLLDIAIKDLTKGDFSNVLHTKFRQPIMEKFGFHFDGVDVQGSLCQASQVAISLVACVVFGIIATLEYFVHGYLPYELLVSVVTEMTPYCTWLFIPTGYFVIRGLLQKTYTLIKKVNSLTETPVDKQ